MIAFALKHEGTLMMNRSWNSNNPFQGRDKKVLCVCSAGLLRSPTAAWVLGNPPFNFNTRAAGLDSYALIVVDDVLLGWADEVVCMTLEQEERLKERTPMPIVCLNIPDNYHYRDPALIELIKTNYLKYSREGLS